MNQRKIQQFPLWILGKFLQILVSIYVYLPIILGILYPMVFLIPIFYISGIIWINLGNWLSAYYLISSDRSFFLIGVEIIIFFVGCALFLMALIQLAQGKKRGEKIVQGGIYRYIRHPQHLGIIVMTLPFTLYIPWVNDFGIRVGDLVTWTCFILLLVIYSDIEEYRLKKRFPEEFSVYQAKIGFLFPKIVQLDQFWVLKRIKENYFLKYSFLLIVFISFLVIFQFIVEKLMKLGLLIAFK